MKLVAVLGCFVLLAGTLAAGAADDVSRGLYSPRTGSHELPFPRSERAQAIWTSGVCWSECGANCAWGVAGCLRRDTQGRCLSLGDTCDRHCLRQCRTSGGPLLGILN